MKKTIALILSLCMSLGFIVSTNRAFAVETSGVVNLDSIIASAPTNFVAGYLADTQYEKTVANSTISIKGTDPSGIIAMGYTGATYFNETLKINAKFAGTFATSPGWDAFYLRSQGNGYNMPINDWSNSKYMFGFDRTNLVTLYRVNGGAYTVLATVTLPAGTNLTAENEYEQSAVTNLNSVDITLTVNGTSVISYSDTAANRITTAGYFGVAAYANDSTITIGKSSAPVVQIPLSVPAILILQPSTLLFSTTIKSSLTISSLPTHSTLSLAGDPI